MSQSLSRHAYVGTKLVQICLAVESLRLAALERNGFRNNRKIVILSKCSLYCVSFAPLTLI